jgi:hypothetical protein
MPPAAKSRISSTKENRVAALPIVATAPSERSSVLPRAAWSPTACCDCGRGHSRRLRPSKPSPGGVPSALPACPGCGGQYSSPCAFLPGCILHPKGKQISPSRRPLEVSEDYERSKVLKISFFNTLYCIMSHLVSIKLTMPSCKKPAMQNIGRQMLITRRPLKFPERV